MKIQDLLNNGFKPGTGKGEFNVCCPYCLERVGKVDTKYKMGVSFNKNVAHCFRCGIVIHFDKNQETEISFKDFKGLDDILDTLNNLNKKPDIDEYDECYDLNLISKPVTKDGTPFAFKYLLERGITQQDIDTLTIRVGQKFIYKNKPSSKWVGRVLLPFIEGGKVLYIVGRDYIDQEPKYLNSKGNKSVILYKVGDFSNREGILCEGILSAISACKYTGVGAVCTLGKYPSDIQLTKLRKICNLIYFSYDADVSSSVRLEVIKSLLRHDFKVKNVKIPLKVVGDKIYKDPDDYKEDYLNIFKKASDIL